MSSPNPGISAAGEAAGRTALDPSTGPAAIGGMLSPGEADGEPPPPPSRPPVKDRLPRVIRSRPRNPLEDRLTAVVSEISNLVTALEALSLKHHESLPVRPLEEGGGGEGSLPPLPTEAGAAGSSQAGSTYGLGATAAAPSTIAGYARLPLTSTDTHRQAASHYRM
jgi:hypothetical protein